MQHATNSPMSSCHRSRGGGGCSCGARGFGIPVAAEVTCRERGSREDCRGGGSVASARREAAKNLSPALHLRRVAGTLQEPDCVRPDGKVHLGHDRISYADPQPHDHPAADTYAACMRNVPHQSGQAKGPQAHRQLKALTQMQLSRVWTDRGWAHGIWDSCDVCWLRLVSTSDRIRTTLDAPCAHAAQAPRIRSALFIYAASLLMVTYEPVDRRACAKCRIRCGWSSRRVTSMRSARHT